MFRRCREQSRTNDADGMEIECMLVNLAKRARARGEVHYGIAGVIDHTFPPKYKQEVFKLLHDIEEAIPQKVLSLAQALRDYREADSSADS